MVYRAGRIQRYLILAFILCIGLVGFVLLVTTIPVTADSDTFYPVADAAVTANLPDTNFGNLTVLKSDDPNTWSYLRFNVQDLAGSITNATLRLYVLSTNTPGFSVRQVANTSWGELTITYNNAPTVGSVINSSGAVTANSWVEVDVTSYVTGEGLYSMALTSANALEYRSGEHANAPELVINTDSGATATPTNTPTATPTNTPTPTATPSLRADFVADPIIGNAPLAVNFYDNSTGSITGYLWNFGDGGSSVMASPVHTYTESGIYTVSLMVADATNQHTLTRTNYIFVNPPSVSLPNQAPIITITNPSLGSVASGTSVQVSGEVTDDVTVQSVEVNGTAATIDGDTFSANITMAGGNQRINAVAEDDEGAMGFDSTVIQIDDEGPIIDIIEPRDRQAVYTLNPTVTIVYRDFLSAVVTNTLSVELTDENSVTDDVTSDLVVGADSATGVLSTPLSQDTSYTLTVTLEDEHSNSGVAISRFYVPLSPTMITPPPEPVMAAWVSGVVYDSSTCNEYLTTCQGLPGVAVTFSYAGSITNSITGTIMTGPGGFFAFPFSETGVYWLRAEKDGYTYSQREIAAVREHSTSVNEIYLTPIDSEVTVCENDSVDCVHESSDGRIQVVIPPGAITEGDLVTVTATTFDRVYFLPSGQLPPGTWETYAFNLGGDSDYVFQKPVTVTISNTLGFAPDTLIPLGFWNQSTMQWEHEGVATVDETGDWVVMRVSHFSNHDPNFPPSLSSILAYYFFQTGDSTPCPDGARGCFIDYHSGSLQEWIDLPSVNILSENVAPQLRYNTEQANPSVVIDVQLDAEVIGQVNSDQLQWQLYIEGERTDNFTFAADLSESGEVGRFRFYWDGRNAQGTQLPPGIYPYAMRVRIPYEAQYCRPVGNRFGNPPDCNRFPTGVYATVAEDEWVYGIVALAGTPNDSLGEGWSLTGQQHLYADEMGDVLVTDAQSQAHYYMALSDELDGRGQYNDAQPRVLGPAAAIPVPPLVSGTFVSGVITSHTTWEAAQSPYIVTGTVTVADGVTLTVEPGVQVMFDQYQSLIVEGEIAANGAVTQPITFTAYVDGPFQSWEKYDLSTFNDIPVQAIAVEANGDVWFAGFYDDGSGNTLGQVHHLHPDLQTWDPPYSIPETFNAFQVNDMAIDRAGQKWIATSNGVIMLDTDDEWTIYQSGTSDLVSDLVYAVAVDNDDNIWFGTDDGVSKLAGGNWTTYQMEDGLASNTVYAIAAGSDGVKWFGTYSGLSRMDAGDNWTTYDTGNSGILGDIVEDIAIDKDNNVWMVTLVSDIDGGGVTVFHQSGEWHSYTPDNSGLASPFVRSIAVDRGGRKWVGYEMDGVSILAADNSAWDYETTPRLSGDTAVAIAAAPAGDIWLGHGGDGATRSYGSDGVAYDNTIRNGYWHTLQIGGGGNVDDSNSSHLSYVLIEAGGADLLSSLIISRSTPALQNVTVSGSGGDGLYIFESSGFALEDSMVSANRGVGIRIEGSAGGYTLTNVLIQANSGHGLALHHPGSTFVTGSLLANNRGHGLYTTDPDNVLTLEDSTVQGNEVAARLAPNADWQNVMWLDNRLNQVEWLGGVLGDDRTWDANFDAHIILGDMTVTESVTLTLEAGVNVLFAGNSKLEVAGSLLAAGTLDAPVYFGPTVGGSWQGVQILGDGTYLRYAAFQGATTGLLVDNSTPILEYLTFLDNDVGLRVTGSDNLVVVHSNFVGNLTYGLENETPGQVVTATQNYWGISSGPYHSSQNPTGAGDAVSDGVTFVPWRNIPVAMNGVGSFPVGRIAPDHTSLSYDANTGTYVRLYPDGGAVYFDEQGRHDTTLYADGRLLSYAYNPDGTTASMSLTAPGESTPNWTWAFSYTNGLLDSITDPAGRATAFAVDANEQLAAVSFPDGSSRAFFYNADGLLTDHVDKNGAINSFTYDGYGRILTDTRPIRAVYDPATGQTNAAAEARVFTPSDTAYPLINDSAVGDPATPATAMPLSADLVDAVAFGRGGLSGYTNQWGNWTEMTDATDRTVQYERDEANNVVQQTYPDGACDQFTYDAFGNVLTARRMGAADCALSNPVSFQEVVMTYEPRFNQVKTITDPLGRATTYIYDYEEDAGQAGKVIRIEYAQVLDEGGNWVTPTVRYTYNSLGLMETEEDKNGMVTRYVYTTITDTQLFLPGVTPVPGLLTQVIEDDGGLALTTTYQDFDAQGTALTEIGPGGEEIIRYATDEMGRVISETNAVGATTIYDYDSQGNLEQRIEDYTPDGVTGANLVTLYTYDADNRLLTEDRVGDGIIVRTSHVADINGNPSHSENALGYETISLYDDANRLVNTIDPAGQMVTYTHDLDGRVESFTDVDGVTNKTFYDDFSRIVRTVTNWEDGVFNPNEPDRDIETLTAYDLVGNTIIVTDTLGRMTRTFYDDLNRVQGAITNWDGVISLDDCDSLLVVRDDNICTRYAYDLIGNTAIVTDTLGRMTRTFYDELNRVNATVVNWHPGTLASPGDCVLSTMNESQENICTLRGYDGKGNLITTTNALNQTNLTVYDAVNRPIIQVTNWDGTTVIEEEADCHFPPQHPDSNVCSVTTYDGLGRQFSSKDALGNVTSYEYDSLGRLITTTRTLDEQMVVSVTSYDALGRRVNQTNAESYTTYFLYDNLGRLIASRSPEGVTSSTGYDAAGRAIASTDNLGHTSHTAYDDLGRVITATNAAEDTTVYEYDGLGNQVAMIDAEGVHATYQYDGLNRRIALIQNDTGGAPTADSNVLTQYLYDALGNQLVITNALGYTSTFTTYDDLNRAIVVENALGNQARTQYNALGLTTVMTDANEAVTQYEYDGLNRLVHTIYETDNEAVSTSYDALGNWRVMTDSVGTTHYEYDDLYRLITVTTPFTGTVVYGYDLVGNRSQITYPDGKVVTYTYDGDNRLVQVFDWDEGVTSYEYDEVGRLVSTLLPNGVETTEAYDAANRLIGRTHTDTISDTLHADYVYELDGLGNHQVVTETIRPPGGGLETTVVSYTYDPLYRVTQVDYSGVLSGTYTYDYDAVGNRNEFTTNITTTQAISYSYDATNRLLESVDLDSSDVTTYTWDNAGRLITTTVEGNVTRVYSYSQDGDLIQAEVEGTTTTFVYDGQGHRLQMSVDGEVVTYTLDYAGGFRILLEEGGEFSDTKHYLYGLACLGEHVDADEPETAEWRYYQRDGKNLVRQTSNQERVVTFAWTYSPTGGVLLGEKGPVTYLDCGDNAIYDWSTGLIFKHGRYFDPTNSLWITLSGVVVWQAWPENNRNQRRKRRDSKRNRKWLLLLLLLLILLLAGCGGGGETPTPTCTPTVTPGLPDGGTPTPGQTDTPTPGGGTPTSPTAPPATPPTVPPPPTTTPTPGLPTPTPEHPTPTPPIPTLPPNIEWLEGGQVVGFHNFKITHYNIAREDDPIFASSPEVSIQGFPPDQKFKQSWVYGRGVLFQGTGLSRDGRYITIDWAKSTYDSNNPENNDWWFKEGIGRDVEEWKTVATVDPRLPMGTEIVIEAYMEKGVFRVTDTGGWLVSGQIDVFVGTKTFAEVDAYKVYDSRVGIVRR